MFLVVDLYGMCAVKQREIVFIEVDLDRRYWAVYTRISSC